MDSIAELRIYYGALGGLLDTIVTSNNGSITSRISQEYDHIFQQINGIVDIDLSYLAASTLKVSDYGCGDGVTDMRVEKIELISKAKQLRGVLESGYNVSDKIVELGSLFNSIKDEELRSRCGDLLTATGHFDRVVNQATQVLEARIQQKSGSAKSGKQLVNEAVKSDIASSILILSNNPNEQEGYSNILRGLMQTLRNSSHHSLATSYTREDAFAVCGFIDQLLRVIDRSSKKP